MVHGWIDASGLAIVVDPIHDQRDLLFEVVEDLEGQPEILEPAYVDSQSSRVIRRGKMRFAPPETGPEPSVGVPDVQIPSAAFEGDQQGVALVEGSGE
jgi:hypothetical protein